ncbi:RNA polymerase sigma factor [Sphingobacterium thalpophilum]|uniref:RNA polymerase sigma factor n=1 Tax=Sphingobacterium thalpophilum TaxID=259 RepID=UPI002D799D7A|nr:sigma-70 family RNA polymerase sigma factor [Sphingobacterium thalpophilum]
MMKTLQKKQTEKYLSLLKQGNERGLDYFYRRFYDYLFGRAYRATLDECIAESIAQEALLRLWLYRQQVQDVADILDFLKRQTRAAIDAFYSKTRNRFHRSLLRLDGIEDYQEFLLGYEIEEEEEIDPVYLERLEEEKQQRMQQLNKLLPNLNQQQQLFIRLCLKYSFNYERIAYYLGGISDYEVSMQVEKTIEHLRSILNSSQKMELACASTKIVSQGGFNEQQTEIFRMRYELQLSFEQIADALRLDTTTVKTLFVQAHTSIRPTQKTA